MPHAAPAGTARLARSGANPYEARTTAGIAPDAPLADLSDGSPQGLHKACARRLAEAGGSRHEIRAISGQKTNAEVHCYTAKAEQFLRAHGAFEKLQDTANNPKPASLL